MHMQHTLSASLSGSAVFSDLENFSDSGRPIITGRRAAARLRVYIPGKLILLDGNYDCTLEDISQTGVRVHCDAVARKGDEGVLHCMAHYVFCEVVRTGNSRIALQFEEEVSLSLVEDIRRKNDLHRKEHEDRFRTMAKQWVAGTIR